MNVKARMKCTENSEFARGMHKIILSAVYSADPADPNFTYSQATPAANLSMTVSNPDAVDEFVVGETYDVTFERR